MPKSKPKAPTLPVQITEAEMRTLAKMLGLLGSDALGERAAAAAKAHAWLARKNLSWLELLLPEPAPTPVKVSVGGAGVATPAALAQARQAMAMAKSEMARVVAQEAAARRRAVEAEARWKAADARETAARLREMAAQEAERRLVARMGGERMGGERMGEEGTARLLAERVRAGPGAAPEGDTVEVAVEDGLPWLAPLEAFLQHHASYLLRNAKEQQFMFDMQARARTWGAACRLTEKQELWMRDILLRAGLTW